ncbi:hypothetical protein L7F22_040911 [Adiantum nelumboides]|nr:hypothetical protein [Adiantum nelumboides]
MENYRTNMVAAQEGCPSLDFTLLDRPSSSSTSALESTAPLFPGENPLSSYHFVDGAGVESHNDRSFPGHRSYMPETAKDVLRRNVSMQVGPLQRQGLGEYHFFGQYNQQSHSQLGDADGHVQSQNISEQLGAGNMPMEYAAGGKTQDGQLKLPSGNTGSLSPSMHVAHPLGGAYVDDRRNQVFGTRQYANDSQDTLSKSSIYLLENSGMLEHQLNANDIASASSLHPQDQSQRYASQNISGNASNETLSRTFQINQLPNGPASVLSEARPGGATRCFGMTELQLLRQQALQSKQQQALQFKQQQAMRLQQQEAMRAQQEAARQQQKMQQEAVREQQQESLRMQRQQEAMRLHQKEVMQSQQEEVFRMQQRVLFLQQQGAARTGEQNAVQWSEEQVGMPCTSSLERQQAIWSQQQKAVWHQRESAEQREKFESQQQQTLLSYQQQASLSNQRQALQFQKGQALPYQQLHLFQNQQRLSNAEQQALRFQQQALQTPQQQVPQFQQEHASSLEHRTLQSQQQVFEPSQQVLSQETCAEFPGTSYSALLHGPDTPPSHTKSGGEISISDLESNTGAFRPANSHSVAWPTYGSSAYQEMTREDSMVLKSVESRNMRPPLHPYDEHNFATAEGEGRQNTQSNYPFTGSREASPVKLTFDFNKPGGENAGVGGCGPVGYSTSDLRSKHQVSALTPFQTSEYLGVQCGRPNSLSSGPMQTNFLSQSQQHFQGLQPSQQRSWERLVQKHGVSKPNFSEASLSLFQGTLAVGRSTLDTGFQQNLSSIGTNRMGFGQDSQQPGSVNSSSCKQHQVFTSAVGDAARNSMDEEERQWADANNVITGQHAGYHAGHSSHCKSDTLGNRVAQLPTPMVRLPVHSGSVSISTSQAILNSDEGTLANMQIPSKITTVRNVLSGQESTLWKENDESRQTSSYLSKSESYSQGIWKQHASFPNLVSGFDSMCEAPSKIVNDSNWKHNFQSRKPIIDAQFNKQAPSLASMSHREQDNVAQPMHEKQLLGHEGVFQQMHNSFSLNAVGSQPVSNSVKALSHGTATSSTESGQIQKLDMSARFQGTAVDKHRISELQVDPSSSRSVSLAHLRQSQPSSPLSLQHVKLGLGPLNLPQTLQQVGIVSTQAFSQIDDSYLKSYGRSSIMEGKKFLAPAGSRSDPNQGITASGNGTLLQTDARPSSALSNLSSFSKESADSEALPPVSITCGVEGSDFPPATMTLSGHAFHGAIGTNFSYFGEESSSTVHGNLRPTAEFNRKPPHSAGSSNQGNYSNGPRHTNIDSGSFHVLQNQQIINMALKQLGNKTQAANLAGLLTTLKTSLSEHSKNAGDHQQLLSVLGESVRIPSVNADEDGNAPSVMQNPQMIWRKVSGPVLKDGSPQLKAASHSVLNEYNEHCRFKQEEGRESTTIGLPTDLQSRESRLITDTTSYPLQSREQGSRLSVLRNLNPVSSQAEVQMRGYNTRPSTFDQDHYLEKQTLHNEGFLSHQVFDRATDDTVQTARLTNTGGAVDKPNVAQLKPSNSPSIHGYLGQMAVSQGDGTPVETAIELEKAQYQRASASEVASHSSLQSADTLPSRQGQLSKQVAINAITGSSLCVGKVVSLRLANDAQSLHNLRLPSNISNEHALHSQKPKQENFDTDNCPQNLLANQATQPAAHLNHLSSRQEDLEDVKVEDARSGVNSHVAILNRLPSHQISPTKRSSPGSSAIHPKKRKKPVPLLIPWYIAATQPRDSLPSTSDMEVMWANTANRLSDKDDGDLRKDNVSSSIKARRRLKLTTQLMQRLIPPVPADLMHGNTPVDNECTTFSLAKFGLEDACRLVTNTRREANSTHDSSENKNMPLCGQGRTWGTAKSVAVTRCVESFMERARGLESELARIETSSFVSDPHWEIGNTEKFAVVNRLAKHHGGIFTVDSSEHCSIDNNSDVSAGMWKPSPKKYGAAWVLCDGCNLVVELACVHPTLKCEMSIGVCCLLRGQVLGCTSGADDMTARPIISTAIKEAKPLAKAVGKMGNGGDGAEEERDATARGGDAIVENGGNVKKEQRVEQAREVMGGIMPNLEGVNALVNEGLVSHLQHLEDKDDEEDEDEDEDKEEHPGTSGHGGLDDDDDHQDDPGIGPSSGGAPATPASPSSFHIELPPPALKGNQPKDMGTTGTGGEGCSQRAGKELMPVDASVGMITNSKRQKDSTTANITVQHVSYSSYSYLFTQGNPWVARYTRR